MLLLFAPLLAAFTSTAAPINCAQARQKVEAARKEPLPARTGNAAIEVTTFAAFCTGWKVLHGWRSDKGGKVVWRARLVQADASGRTTTITVTSLSCPAFGAALASLDDVPVSLAVMQRPAPKGSIPPPPEPTDGDVITLQISSAIQQGRYGASVNLSASHGPIADWAHRTFSELQSCWVKPG